MNEVCVSNMCTLPGKLSSVNDRYLDNYGFRPVDTVCKVWSNYVKKNQLRANLLFLGFHNTFSFGFVAQIVRFNFVHSNSKFSFFGGGT